MDVFQELSDREISGAHCFISCVFYIDNQNAWNILNDSILRELPYTKG